MLPANVKGKQFNVTQNAVCAASVRLSTVVCESKMSKNQVWHIIIASWVHLSSFTLSVLFINFDRTGIYWWGHKYNELVVWL